MSSLGAGICKPIVTTVTVVGSNEVTNILSLSKLQSSNAES